MAPRSFSVRRSSCCLRASAARLTSGHRPSYWWKPSAEASSGSSRISRSHSAFIRLCNAAAAGFAAAAAAAVAVTPAAPADRRTAAKTVARAIRSMARTPSICRGSRQAATEATTKRQGGGFLRRLPVSAGRARLGPRLFRQGHAELEHLVTLILTENDLDRVRIDVDVLMDHLQDLPPQQRQVIRAAARAALLRDDDAQPLLGNAGRGGRAAKESE